ncbi:MAG: hypothetical protein HOY76_21170 [Streptomyces sp.]|nr:hypothetical protein [Streptomyces sp.]
MDLGTWVGLCPLEGAQREDLGRRCGGPWLSEACPASAPALAAVPPAQPEALTSRGAITPWAMESPQNTTRAE